MPNLKFTRRSILQMLPGLILPAFSLSCDTIDGIGRGMHTKLKKDVLWARRQEWKGPEMVKSIAQFGDRFILVKWKHNQIWDFPGGIVHEKIHGPKAKDNIDLVNAVTEYTHDQAMVPIVGGTAQLVSYGYGIDMASNQTYMVYWLKVIIPTNMIPPLNPNLTDTAEAKWVALDDPFLKGCLEERIKEYKKADEGGTVILESCRD